ncbi:MAG: alpha/beta-type small acid-soluble spore protein [Firmicutes bacterium]|nr:alpha/beta-type small acid-soluble spore protein [Bacillota bacterium]
MSNTNKLVVPGSKMAIENLKYEVARELGIQLGADTSSRLNGTVGGEMTKRLVNLGKQYYANVNNKIK